jgi:hypothetical protein
MVVSAPVWVLAQISARKFLCRQPKEWVWVCCWWPLPCADALVGRRRWLIPRDVGIFFWEEELQMVAKFGCASLLFSCFYFGVGLKLVRRWKLLVWFDSVAFYCVLQTRGSSMKVYSSGLYFLLYLLGASRCKLDLVYFVLPAWND